MTAPNSRFPPPLRAYLVSPLLVVLTTWLLLLVQSLVARAEVGIVRPFGIGFLLDVAVIAMVGGRGPGFFTLALSSLSLILVLTPLGTGIPFGHLRDWAELFFMLAIGGFLVRGLEELRTNTQLLAESEEARSRLRAVMDTAPVGVLLSNKAGKPVYANQEAERIWGQPLEAVRQEDWTRHHLLDLDGTPTPPRQTGLARALAGKSSVVRDERIIEQPDGTRVFVQTSSMLVRDGSGRVRSGLVVFSDITERQRAEQRIAHLLARERLINRISQTSLQTRDPDQIHAEATQGLRELLGVDSCLFTLDAPDGSLHTPGHTLVVEDAWDAAVPAAEHDFWVRMGQRAAVATPLFSGGRLLMTLTAGMKEAPRAWTEDEVALVEAVAIGTQAAAEAARSRQREHAIALALQDALLPALPKSVPGLEMAYYYKAALEEAQVGGDFLDVFALQDGRVVFAVGDLSGKGLAAASQVATVRNMLRYSLYRTARLDQAILELNDTVVAHELLTGFATLFVGIYDRATRTLTYLSCGHDPGLVRRANGGPVELLPPDGDSISPVLGLTEGGRFTAQSVTLLPGDTLFFCTDGVTEAGRSRGEFLGVAGVAQMLGAGRSGEPVEELITRIVSEVRDYADGIQHDDVCLLAAIIGGQPS